MLVSENSLLSKNSHKSSFNNDNNSVSYPSRTIVHPKLEMTEPGDADEQEADVAANEVMSGKVFRKFSGGGAGGGMAVSSQMESQLNQLQGGGQAMPDGLRGMMERGFDRDFSQVRLHTDGEAAGLSDSIHAKAFTHGNDIYFNQGQYAPETSEGQRLVAHELAHVAQGGGKVGRAPLSSHMKNYNSFVSDDSWILDEESRTRLRNNYLRPRNKRNRKPLTVFLYTTWDEGHDALDVNENQLFRDLIRDESRTRVLMIQGKSSLPEYIECLINMTIMYGPLQNVVLMGHGSHNSVGLGNGVEIDTSENSKDFYRIVRVLFEEADRIVGRPLPHSFLMPVCLTGANDETIDGLVNHVQTRLGGNVYVKGNKAPVRIKEERFYYTDFHDRLRDSSSADFLSFENMEDWEAPIRGKLESPVGVLSSDRTYKQGEEVRGVLVDIKQQIERLRCRSSEDGTMSYLDLDYPRVNVGTYIYYYNVNETHRTVVKEFYVSKDVMKVIRDHGDDISRLENFVNCLYFGLGIPVSRTLPRPSLEELFVGAQSVSDIQRESWRWLKCDN